MVYHFLHENSENLIQECLSREIVNNCLYYIRLEFLTYLLVQLDREAWTSLFATIV